MANNSSNTNHANNANNAIKQTPAVKDDPAEEQQLEDMLNRLDEVHLQLRRLRMALPRMLQPLMTKQPSPQATFAAYMQSVDSTNKELASFQAAFLGLQTDGIFHKARVSRKENPMGLKQWRASEHPDWADSDRKRRRVAEP